MSTTASPAVRFGASHHAADSQSLSDGEQQSTMIAMLASVAILIGVYWNTMTLTKDYWNDDTYSHGWIIPFIAVFLMWAQRKPLGGAISRDQENRNMQFVAAPLVGSVACYFLGLYGIGWLCYAVGVLVALGIVFYFHEFEPIAAYERWIGVLLISAAAGLRVYGTYFEMLYLDRYSFIIALGGVFFLAGGWAIVKRMWPAIAFCFFMMPLPSRVEHFMLGSLQKVATIASTTVLQVLGVGAYREGSRITVDGLSESLEVIGACAGLRMLTIFCAMVIAMVLLIERPWWDKLILLLSAIPIALVTNVIRITATALLFLAVEGSSMQEPLHEHIHDYAGYAMIFVAGGIMWLEYKVLSWLFVEEGDEVLHASGLGAAGLPVGRN